MMAHIPSAADPNSVHPWDRRPNEGSQAFASFVVYRDLGPSRSLDKAYFAVRGKLPPRGRANGTWMTWSAKYKWVERAQAWDDYLQKLADRQREAAVNDAADRLEERRRRQADGEATLAEQLGRRLLEFLNRELYRTERVRQDDGSFIEQEIRIEEMSYSNVAQLLRAFSTVGRAGLGMAHVDEDDPDPSRFKEIFFRTRGQMAARIPEGSLPAMPVNPAAKPVLSKTIDELSGSAHDSDFIVPKDPPRPGENGNGKR